MADIMTSEQRSERMRKIRSHDTKPEIVIRKLIHHMGYRYRIHVKDLPGTPDIVFSSRRKIIFVHGCFWHMHEACRDGKIPGSRKEYWEPKLFRTRARDEKHQVELANSGWATLIIWECELSDLTRVELKIKDFLT